MQITRSAFWLFIMVNTHGVLTYAQPASPVSQPAVAVVAPSDAEKIARLQRAIDDSKRQISELSAKIEDPKSEFAEAEIEFAKLDRQLQELKKQSEGVIDDGSSTREKLQAELDELIPKHMLAKDRFDLAIREKKTLQEQIATLQQKMAQDSEALRRLKGETLSASQPAREVGVASGSESVPVAVPNGQADAGAQRSTTATAAPGAEANSAAAQPATLLVAPGQQVAVVKPVAPEVAEAKKDAHEKAAAAQSAKEEVASITDRIAALQKGIELERKQFETTRSKSENAEATERTLYEALQKKWEAGAPQKELAELRVQITEARSRLNETQNELRERTDRLNGYQAELADLQSERIAAMDEARRIEAEALRAQKRVDELQSPLTPRNMWRWLVERGPKVGAIALAMFVILWTARVAENRLVTLVSRRSGPGTREDRENRARTLFGIAHSAATLVVYGGGGMMILTEFGVNIVPLMGGAAVFGLAVAFGAQNLIRDYFYGFMILLENQYTVNDVVKIGDVAGQVERISLRVTVLRGLDGTAHFVPNGEVTRVSNMTHEWSRALFDIPVAYKEDVDLVMNELIELGKELRRDPNFRGLITDLPEMLGVDEFADSAVVIKFFIKTRPLKQWTVKREMLRRIKRRFDELGIEIPVPQSVVFHRQEQNADLHMTYERKT